MRVIEQLQLHKQYFLVDANTNEEALKKFESGDFYFFGNVPEFVEDKKTTVRKVEKKEEEDPLYKRVLSEIQDSNKPEQIPVKKKRGRPRK